MTEKPTPELVRTWRTGRIIGLISILNVIAVIPNSPYLTLNGRILDELEVQEIIDCLSAELDARIPTPQQPPSDLHVIVSN